MITPKPLKYVRKSSDFQYRVVTPRSTPSFSTIPVPDLSPDETPEDPIENLIENQTADTIESPIAQPHKQVELKQITNMIDNDNEKKQVFGRVVKKVAASILMDVSGGISVYTGFCSMFDKWNLRRDITERPRNQTHGEQLGKVKEAFSILEAEKTIWENPDTDVYYPKNCFKQNSYPYKTQLRSSDLDSIIDVIDAASLMVQNMRATSVESEITAESIAKQLNKRLTVPCPIFALLDKR